MANGKRRANWEKVLEERMDVVQMLISNLNTDLLNQITDLQNEIYVMKKKAVRDRYALIVVVILGILAAVAK